MEDVHRGSKPDFSSLTLTPSSLTPLVAKSGLGFATDQLQLGGNPFPRESIQAVTPENRIRRAKVLREIEGYLELGLAGRALCALGRLGDPTDFDVHTLRLWGEALRMLERYDEAIVPLQQAADAAPDDIRIRLGLGWCYKRTGHLDLAIESLERAVCCEPNKALLHYNLACYWSLAGSKRHALTCLSRAIRIDTSCVDMIDDEPDFDPIRFDPDFQALCDRNEARG